MTESTALIVRDEGALAPFRAALEPRLDKIAELLPQSMDARRFMSVSLMALTKNPDLLKCDRVSFTMAVLEAAEIGLEPTGGVGGAHLVPFGGKVQLIYDYRGIQYLIREGGGGEVKTVLVYEGDLFKVYEGTERARIVHTKRFQSDDPTKITYVYAVPLDHPEKFEVMTKAQVDAIRARSKAANRGPWVTDYGAMARKSVLKRIAAWLPLKPSARDALERDTRRELGEDEDGEPTTVRSRTAEVRDKIRGNSGRRRQRPVAAPSARESTPDAETTAPADSAAQRTDEAVEGESREVCGEGSDPKLGPVETCVLEPDHLTKEVDHRQPPQRHQSASGSVWPAKRKEGS